MQRPSERRAEQRVDVNLSGTLTSGENSSVCSIRNICSKGFLIEANTGLRSGQVVQLDVRLYPDKLVTCTVQIKHVNAQRLGAMVLEIADGDRVVCQQFIAEQLALRSR